MCRELEGFIRIEGPQPEIISGSNDDPALDFDVFKEDLVIGIKFKVPFAKEPAVIITPVYPASLQQYTQPNRGIGRLLLISNQKYGFRVLQTSNASEINCHSFSFTAMG